MRLPSAFLLVAALSLVALPLAAPSAAFADTDTKDPATRTKPAEKPKRPPGMTEEQFKQWKKDRAKRKQQRREDMADLLASPLFDAHANGN